MQRSPSRHAFTLIEMITVMAIIAILVGLILSIAGLVQNKGARARTEGEIQTLKAALEAYKSDNGGYPQDTKPDGSPGFTDTLDPRTATSPSTAAYKDASLILYRALSGDYDANGRVDATDGNYDAAGRPLAPPPADPEIPKSYAADFFKPSRLGGTKDANGQMTTVTYLQDPFSNSYGYSTAGLRAEQNFRVQLQTNPDASRPPAAGYSPSFDLWSTGGTTSSSANDRAKWLKSW